MARLSNYAKKRIALLYWEYKINGIVRILESEDVHTTRQTVVKFIRKYEGNEVTVKKPIGRKPKLNREHLNFIDQQLERNYELCAIGKFITYTYSIINTALFCIELLTKRK